MKIAFTVLFLLLVSAAFAQGDSGKVLVSNLSKQEQIKETTNSKIEVINPSFDKLVSKLTKDKKDDDSIWRTLIPLLIGAGLTLLAQFSIEYWKTRKENEIKKRELISKGQARIYLIAQILKDLAMYKVHKQYYARGAQIEQDGSDSFKKHYEKGQQQRETETRLDDNIAEYFQLVTEYSIVTKNFDHFQQYFGQVFHFIHPKSGKFEDCNSEQELIQKLQSEETRLNSEYRNLVAIFETIQSEMK